MDSSSSKKPQVRRKRWTRKVIERSSDHEKNVPQKAYPKLSPSSHSSSSSGRLIHASCRLIHASCRLIYA